MATVNPAPPKQPLVPPDPTRIAETVRKRLPLGGDSTGLTPLAGDASNRRYFRVHLAGASCPSVILMQLAEPEAFKASEEAVSGTSVVINELPFINIRSHLAGVEAAVPDLYHYDQEAGLLYLEDFGDVTLAEACLGHEAGEMADLYRDAVGALANIHRRATEARDPRCLAFHRAFDVPLLMWEFEHFLEYGVEARLGERMAEGDARVIRKECHKIAAMLAEQPQVFTHRDYHSRNLMVRSRAVKGSRLGIIDFQDALLGPAVYDLASLLRDAYIALDEALIDELIAQYFDEMTGSPAVSPDSADLRRVFDLTSIQRNLKAAGRFVYIDRVKGNPKFLADIPRVLGYVHCNLARYPELAALRRHLSPYVPELQ